MQLIQNPYLVTVPEYRDAGCGGNAPPIPTRTKPNLPNSPQKNHLRAKLPPENSNRARFRVIGLRSFCLDRGWLRPDDRRSHREVARGGADAARTRTCVARGAAPTPTVTHRPATALSGSKDRDKDGVAPDRAPGRQSEAPRGGKRHIPIQFMAKH